jgi:F-type H+-transporting ATPase subunit a
MIFWQNGFLKLNGTIVFTWGLMFALAAGSKLITRRLSTGLSRSRWQNLLEIVVTAIEKQIGEVGVRHPEKYLGFLGTLFLFIAMANLCTVIPGYEPPTGSLSTTVALALCVFVAVPFFGIEEQGLGGYLRSYVEPTVIMLPFNIISEVSRTLALSVRLFGNMMSGVMIIAILLTITPFLFPIVMTALGLLTGMVQAYIFTILAAVYIAAATGTRKRKPAQASAHNLKQTKLWITQPSSPLPRSSPPASPSPWDAWCQRLAKDARSRPPSRRWRSSQMPPPPSPGPYLSAWP